MGLRCVANRRRALRDERGFTLVEVMVAALILVVGLSVMFIGFVGPQKLSLTAQRESQASAIAESDLETIVGRPFADIQLSSNNAHVSDPTPSNPTDPRYFVSTDTEASPAPGPQPGYKILDDYHNASGAYNDAASPGSPGDVTSSSISTNGVEPFVAASATNSLAASVATPAGGPAGTIYRFFTYRSELCSPTIQTSNTTTNPLSFLGGVGDLVNTVLTFVFGKIQHFATNTCGTHNIEKRVTVAVVLTVAGNGSGPLKPVYASTVVPDPSYGSAQSIGIKSCGSNGLIPALCTLIGYLTGL